MSEKPSVYLAGPVKEAENNGRVWRDDIKLTIGWADWIDPLEKYDIGDACDPDITDEEIVANDLDMIDEADGMLVYFRESVETMGTPMEIFYAHQQGIPVSVYWGPDTIVSPWLQTFADYVTGVASDAVAWLEQELTDAEDPTGFKPHRVTFMNPADEPRDLGVETPETAIDHTTADLSDATDEAQSVASGDAMARTLLEDAGQLVDCDRDTHGDAVENQEHISDGWTWYLRGMGVLADDQEITGGDVGRMMGILKMSRTSVGEYDVDHDRDVAGYAGIAAACEVSRGNSDASELTVMDEETDVSTEVSD